MEMTYKFYLDTDRYVSLRLPVPFKELKKREQNKVIKWAKESVDAVYHKSRIEAQGLRDAYLKKAKELEEKYALKNGGTYEHQEKGN